MILPCKGDLVVKRVTITVVPSADHPEYLTVQDAMSQIADAFALLKGTDDGVDWRLVDASTNSPLTAIGEMIAPGLPDIPPLALVAADEAYQSLNDVLAGEAPSGDLDGTILRRVLARNMNGIGLTKIEFDDHPAILITPNFASAGLDAIEPTPILRAVPRRVRGSLEGELITAGHYYRRPALKLRERTQGRILWCTIPEALRDQITSDTSLEDVWQFARVRIRGWIEYSPRGVITGMSAERIQHVRARGVSASDLYDPEFTEGLDSVTYLDRLRDGKLG